MKKLFAVVAGERLAGKTTLAGTLPGRTLLMQCAIKESGSLSAQKLAKRNGYQLQVATFADLAELLAMLPVAAKSPDYDHLYIDGFSALNDLRWGMPDMQKLAKNDQWKAFGMHGEEMTQLLENLKRHTYLEHGGKNVWLTCALKVKTEGTEKDVDLECKGKIAVSSITRLGEAVLIPMSVPAENGGTRRIILTKSYDKWPARIDGLLDDENPGYVEPSLANVMALIEGDKVA